MSFTISVTFSLKLSMFRICYLFFNMALLSDLVSSVTLSLRSFLTVITAGWMNISSVIISTLLMCPSSRWIFVSSSTAFYNCSGIPFLLMDHFCIFLRSNFIVCPTIFPCLLKIIENFCFINFSSGDSFTLFTLLFTLLLYSLLWLPSTTWKFNWASQSRPTSYFSPHVRLPSAPSWWFSYHLDICCYETKKIHWSPIIVHILFVFG